MWCNTSASNGKPRKGERRVSMKRLIPKVLAYLMVLSLAVVLVCVESLAAGGKGNVGQLGKQIYVWHFDEGHGKETKDATAGLVGTIEGDVKWAEGISGKCLEFSGEVGSAQYVEIAHCDEIDIDEQITMAAWLYPDSLPTGGQENKFTVFFKLAYYMQLEPGDGKASKIAYYFYDANPPGYHLSDGTVNAGEWTHIAVVWDGKEASFYINGKKDSSIAQTGTGRSNTEGLQFGGEDAACCPRFFQGRLDDVTLANYALSEAEITELMATAAVEPYNRLSITWGKMKRIQ
jgi:hypothetical protein